MLIVTKILGHRQRGVPNSKPTARRLVHLAVDHHHVFKHASVFHPAIEFLALAASLANSAKDAHAVLMADHVVNHFCK